MIEKAINSLRKGLTVNRYSIRAVLLPRARFREEVNLDITIGQEDSHTHLMFAKCFKGRPPHYKPWIELFDIIPSLQINDRSFDYFDSVFEDTILHFFTQALKFGENIFVEYYRDGETLVQLQKTIPVPATRLGYKLFSLGYTWFKDWYFPEGFMEGEQKLQAERPLDSRSRKRQNRNLYDELEAFVTGYGTRETPLYLKRALERARKLLIKLEE